MEQKDNIKYVLLDVWETLLFSNKNEIRNKDVQECLNVKESSARNYLNNLCKKEILIKNGENNKTVYRIKDISILN